jgi:hypothetical protein
VNFALMASSGQRLDHWDPNAFAISLVTGIAALIIVSYVTTPEPATTLDPFFARFAEPVEGTAAPGTRLLLADLATGLKKGASYKEDVNGFLIGWALVAALVGATWLWLRT